MSLELPALPLTTPIVEESKSALLGTSFTITKRWAEALRARDERLQAAAHTDTSVSLPAQTATIAATALVTAADAPAYRISATLAQTVTAGVSAAFQITIRWTYNAVSRSRVGANVNGNTSASGDEMPAFMVLVDAGTNITYECSYASDPAATAQFDLTVNAEQMG